MLVISTNLIIMITLGLLIVLLLTFIITHMYNPVYLCNIRVLICPKY